MRYPLLDGFRGFFLLFMTIIHANEILDTVAGKLNHHYFGWVEDAQGFVFISGFVVALVYGRALDRKGFQG
ncbi:MAG: OpgC domain-containing protein, partial [Sandaracinobacteroides sp.]